MPSPRNSPPAIFIAESGGAAIAYCAVQAAVYGTRRRGVPARMIIHLGNGNLGASTVRPKTAGGLFAAIPDPESHVPKSFPRGPTGTAPIFPVFLVPADRNSCRTVKKKITNSFWPFVNSLPAFAWDGRRRRVERGPGWCTKRIWTEAPRTAAPTAVRDAHRFDSARLDAWMAARSRAMPARSRVEQFKGGQSNPTYKLAHPGPRLCAAPQAAGQAAARRPCRRPRISGDHRARRPRASRSRAATASASTRR